MKNRLRDHLAVLLPEEGPFPPHPGSRVSTHQQNRTEKWFSTQKALNLLGSASDLANTMPTPHHRPSLQIATPPSPHPKAAPPRRITTRSAVVARPKPRFSPGVEGKGKVR
jgi:hypothetical protein